MKINFTLILILIIAAASGQDQIQKSTDGKGINDFVSTPHLKWKYNTSGPVYASPVIDNKVVYIGSLDSSFYALHLESGKVLWRFKTKGPIRSTAGLDQNKVMVLSGDGQVYALEKSSGKVLWTFSTKGEKTYSLYSYADYNNSSLIVNSGVVFFGSGDGNIYALKTSDGTKVWSFQTGDVVHATPAIDKDKLFIGSFDGYFYALQLSSGNLIWKFKSVGQHFFPKGEFQGSPVVDGEQGLVFVGSRDFNLYAIDVERGFCHWNKRYNSWCLALTCRDKVLYAGTADDDTMYAYETLTGKELWKNNVRFNIFGAPAVGPGQIYFGTQQGKLLSLDRKTGDGRWVFKTDGYKAAFAEYFVPEDSFVKNDFYAKVFKDGVDHYIRVLEQLGAVYGTPALTAQYLLFGSADGGVYCLDH